MTEILCDEDNVSPIREISHDVNDDEQIMDMNNHVAISPNIFSDGVSLCIYDPNPLCTGNSSPTRSGKIFKQSFKHVLKNRVYQLEAEVKELCTNTLGNHEEIKTIKL